VTLRFLPLDQLQCTLTVYPLTTTIVAPPRNASKWQMGFNSAFKGLNRIRPLRFSDVGGLNSNYCPRQSGFKFLVTLNAFTTILCTDTGFEGLHGNYTA
jgi:hypothetical protein